LENFKSIAAATGF